MRSIKEFGYSWWDTVRRFHWTIYLNIGIGFLLMLNGHFLAGYTMVIKVAYDTAGV